MISKIKLLLTIIFLVSIYRLSAQFDNNSSNKDNLKIKGINLKNSQEIKETNSIELIGNRGFKDAFEKAVN